MRVALLSYECADYSIQLANGLARECDVLLMVSREGLAEHPADVDESVTFQPFDKPRLRQPVRQLRTAAGSIRQMRRFRPDVIHLQHGHMWFNMLLPLLTIVSARAHDSRSAVPRGRRASQRTPAWFTTLAYRQVDRVIVHGDVLKQQVIDNKAAATENVHVVPHVAIGAANAPANCHDDGKTVLFFGRIWGYKGLKYLIEAEPIITRAIPDVRIVIAGEGDNFEQYRRLMGGSQRFEVHNRFVPIEERDQLFEQASVVALPYIEATQSGVIPVAYSFAKPVVATGVGALTEAVEDGVTGLLVPPADSESLAAAIIELLRDPQRRQTMGAAGRRKLDTEWSPSVIARKTIDVYEKAIHAHKTARGSAARSDHRPLEMHESAAQA